MGKLIPEDILENRSGQIIPFPEIAAMVSEYGFTVKGRTPHRHCQHREYRHITFGLHVDPDSVCYQRDAAAACLEAKELSRQPADFQQTAMEITEEKISPSSFFPESGYCLSPYTDSGDSYMLVSVRGFPDFQIPCEDPAPPETLQHTKDSLCNARDSVLQEWSDIDPDIDVYVSEQKIFINDKINNKTTSIDPAVRGSSYDARPDVENVILEIMRAHTSLEHFVHEQVKRLDGDPSLRTPLQNGGERLSVPCRHFLTGEEKTRNLDISHSRRVSVADFLDFLATEYMFQMGGETFPDDLNDNLARLGLELVKHKKDSRQIALRDCVTNTLIMTFPYEDMKQKMEKLCADLQSKDVSILDHELDKFIEIYNRMKEITENIKLNVRNKFNSYDKSRIMLRELKDNAEDSGLTIVPYEDTDVYGIKKCRFSFYRSDKSPTLTYQDFRVLIERMETLETVSVKEGGKEIRLQGEIVFRVPLESMLKLCKAMHNEGHTVPDVPESVPHPKKPHIFQIQDGMNPRTFFTAHALAV